MFDLDRFIEDCRAALRERAPEIAMKELVARTVAEPAEIERVLGTPASGGAVRLHHSPELTILNVVWTPGMAIYPHDHRLWAVIGLYGGREDNTFYRRDGQGLVEAGGKRLETSDTTVLGRDVIHAVANPLRRYTGAIHVYGGDFYAIARSEWDPETREERPYDVHRAMKVFTDADARWRQQCGADSPRTHA
jgi:predicted metal-dependent enzyme (double-stranded beta helix superfamily)